MAQQRPAATAAQQDQGDETQVLEEAAIGLRDLAARLPERSRWRESLAYVADSFAAGATLSRMADQASA